MHLSNVCQGAAGGSRSSETPKGKRAHIAILRSVNVSLRKRLLKLEKEVLNSSVTVCGLQVEQEEVEHAIKVLARRVKVTQHQGKVLKDSSLKLKRQLKDRERMLDRMRAQRDEWHRTAKAQQRAAEAKKAELEQKVNRLNQEAERLFEELAPFR